PYAVSAPAPQRRQSAAAPCSGAERFLANDRSRRVSEHALTCLLPLPGRPMRHLLLPLLLAPALLAAQPSTGGHPDYAKADLIGTSGAFVLNATVTPIWFRDSTRFYYRSSSPRGESVVYVVDPAKRTKTPLFDNIHLAQVMSLAGDTTVDPTKIPNFRLSD